MRAQINDNDIHYDDYGHGPAVLFLHDFPLNRKMWKPQIDAVTAAGFRVIAPDLRGFGSSTLKNDTCEIGTYSDDIIALLNSLGIGRAAVCGLSMGGYVLFDLIERYPERIAGACLVSTRPVADDIHERARRGELLNALNQGRVDEVRDDLCAMLIAGHDRKLAAERKRDIQALTRDVRPETLADALKAISQRKDYTFLLKQIDTPTLIIGAEQDQITHPHHSDLMAQQLPNCHDRVKLDCGHLVNMEKAKSFNSHLLRFLRKLRPAPVESCDDEDDLEIFSPT